MHEEQWTLAHTTLRFLNLITWKITCTIWISFPLGRNVVLKSNKILHCFMLFFLSCFLRCYCCIVSLWVDIPADGIFKFKHDSAFYQPVERRRGKKKHLIKLHFCVCGDTIFTYRTAQTLNNEQYHAGLLVWWIIVFKKEKRPSPIWGHTEA